MPLADEKRHRLVWSVPAPWEGEIRLVYDRLVQQVLLEYEDAEMAETMAVDAGEQGQLLTWALTAALPLHPAGRRIRALLDKLGDLACCCLSHPSGCPGHDCDGCADCLAGEARRLLTSLDGEN